MTCLLLIDLGSSVFAQSPKITDTAAFKKDFESLLSKYGITSKGYMINVTSVNQSGGQTAFIITNNYFSEAPKDSVNFEFTLSEEKSLLTVYPKRGIWSSPFVATDSAKAGRDFFNPGIGVVSSFHGMEIYVDSTKHICNGLIRSGACSKNFPVYIWLGKNDPDQLYVFGDMQDPGKTYLYYKGKISWLPMKELP